MAAETPQVAFWRGAFGDAHADRNVARPEHICARVTLWAEILARLPAPPPQSIIEFGANIGNNLWALRGLTDATLHALEPNACACVRLVDDAAVPAANALTGFDNLTWWASEKW